MSPERKKRKTLKESISKKREHDSEEGTSKRSKSVKNAEDDLQAKRRKNFVTACEQVSFKEYTDYKARFLLLYFPECMKTSECIHQESSNINIKEIPQIIEESFMIDLRTNMWSEAIEVCVLCTSPTQYLSPKVLKEVVEIILNAHEEESAEEPVSFIIDKCQQVLMQHFGLHPPCSKKLRKCYTDFLTSPLELKEKTFTNRKEFGYDKGVVKYCLNRLEYEISVESKEESLIDKYEHIPEEMKQTVKGLHWQKEKFEIYEVLERTERIDRLMAVLESIVELLQFDLALWHSRYKQNLGSHIMRSHKPLMAYILWSSNVLYTGVVNNNVRQILKIFAHLVHLHYPEKYIKVMTLWLNTVVQTFYVCESNSNSDYPNIGKYCMSFGKEFYKIISDLPHNSIIRVLDHIKPTYMRHIVGTKHLENILQTNESCIIKNLLRFTKESQWKNYQEVDSEVKITQKRFFEPMSAKRALRQLYKRFDEWESLNITEEEEGIDRIIYPKMDSVLLKNQRMESNFNCDHVIKTLFLTLEAYLSSYNIQNVQETLNSLNDQLAGTGDSSSSNIDYLGAYSVTEAFVKKYRSIYQMLRDLVVLFQERKSDLPDMFKIFKRIELLDL